MAIESREPVFRARASRVGPTGASKIVTNAKRRGNRRIPLFIPADQAYYWSNPWQRDVAQSMEALRNGEFVDFDSDDPMDVAKWLLSVDEDDCD
jgi:hypothetical protein